MATDKYTGSKYFIAQADAEITRNQRRPTQSHLPYGMDASDLSLADKIRRAHGLPFDQPDTQPGNKDPFYKTHVVRVDKGKPKHEKPLRLVQQGQRKVYVLE